MTRINHKRTIRRGIGGLAALSFLTAFFSYMDGNLSSAFWGISYGFLGIGLALAYDDHTIPIDGTEDKNRSISRGQKFFTYLALITGGTMAFAWYVTEFMKFL